MREMSGEEIMAEYAKKLAGDDFTEDIKSAVLNQFNHKLKITDEIPEEWSGSVLTENETDYMVINYHKDEKYIMPKKDVVLTFIVADSFMIVSEPNNIETEFKNFADFRNFLKTLNIKYLLEVFGDNCVSLYDLKYYAER